MTTSPAMSGLGTTDLGIVGQNLIYEEGVDVEELIPMGFGFCSLVVAVMRDSPYQTIDDIKTPAHRDVVSQIRPPFFRPSTAPIRRSSPSVDRSRSRQVLGTCRCNRRAYRDWIDPAAQRSAPDHHDSRIAGGARRQQGIMQDPEKKVNIDRLVMRVNAVRAARRYKYVMMNARGRRLCRRSGRWSPGSSRRQLCR